MAVESWWPYRDGRRSTYYLSAYRRGNRVYAVFAEEDLWRAVKFHVPRESHADARPELHVRCRCGFDKTIHGFPCPTCQKPICPKCETCGCTIRAQREAMCRHCTRRFASHLLDVQGL